MRSGKLAMLFLALLIFSTSFAQKNSGTIQGSVLGGSRKLPLTEAVITLTSAALSGSRIVLTDSTGKYKINNLVAGTYSLTFEMEGYKTQGRNNVVLAEGETMGLNIELARGKDKNRVAEARIITVSDRRRS